MISFINSVIHRLHKSQFIKKSIFSIFSSRISHSPFKQFMAWIFQRFCSTHFRCISARNRINRRSLRNFILSACITNKKSAYSVFNAERCIYKPSKNLLFCNPLHMLGMDKIYRIFRISVGNIIFMHVQV